MLDDALDRAILTARVAALHYDKHLVAVPDDVLLDLDELDLQVTQRRLVAGAPICIALLLGAFLT